MPLRCATLRLGGASSRDAYSICRSLFRGYTIYGWGGPELGVRPCRFLPSMRRISAGLSAHYDVHESILVTPAISRPSAVSDPSVAPASSTVSKRGAAIARTGCPSVTAFCAGVPCGCTWPIMAWHKSIGRCAMHAINSVVQGNPEADSLEQHRPNLRLAGLRFNPPTVARSPPGSCPWSPAACAG